MPHLLLPETTLQAEVCPAPLPQRARPAARTDVLGAGVAVLGVEGLEAAAAVGPAVLHDVPLPPQHRLAFKAAEVLHVPVPPFGLGAFVGKNDLGVEWRGGGGEGGTQM